MMWRIAIAALPMLALLGCEPIAETTDWDARDADAIGYDEWAPGFREAGMFETWDVDDDNLLFENEWMAGFDSVGGYDANRWGTYSDWDRDVSGYLDDIEFSSGVFDAYDLDGDAVLMDDEVGAFEDDWM